ncbi:MAG: TonB-dependent receptor [Balneolales bacterium]
MNYRTVLIALLTLVFFMANSLAHASQSDTKGRVYGYITDAASGEALGATNVQVANMSSSRSANSEGYYELRLEPGVHTITFTYLGFEAWQEEVDVLPNQSQQVDAILFPADILLADLVVEGAPVMARSLTGPGTMDVPMEYLNSMGSALHSDVFRSIQLMPGVMASSDFSSGLHVRGGSPDQTLILVDGVTVYNPTHFYGFFSTFNPDIVESVTLHKGVYPAAYGGRLGSVVDVRNSRGDTKQTGGSVSLGLLSSRATLQGPHSTGSYMLAFRRSTLEPTLSVLRSMEEENIPDHFHFYDLNASMQIDAGPDDNINLSLYNSMDNLSYPLNDMQNFTLRYGNQTGAVNWDRNYSGRLSSSVSFSASRYFNSPAFGYGRQTAAKDNRVEDYSGRVGMEWVPNGRSQLMAGVSAGHISFNMIEGNNDINTFSSHIANAYTAGYLQANRQLGERWQLNAGLRGSWYSNGNYLRMEPRLTVDYSLTSRSAIKASAGRYYQFASLITSESISGFDVWLSTAENVPPSYSNQYSLGYKTGFLDSYELEAGAYYRTMHDMFELDPFGGDPSGKPYEDLFYFEEGFAAGLEVFLSRYTGWFTGFMSYTLGTTQKRSPQVNDNLFYPHNYDRLHDLNVVAKVRLSDHWEFSSVFSYGSGQPYTQPLGGVVLNDIVERSRPVPVIVGGVNANRLPAYHRLDAGITRSGRLFNKVASELRLEVVNVYSRRNVWFYNYSFDEESAKTAVTMLPVIPSLTYTLSF